MAEYLNQLDDDAIEVFILLFKRRLLNQDTDEDSRKLWLWHITRLIPKRAGAVEIKQLRPIALFPVIFKWYSAVLSLLAMPFIDRLRAPQFAFRGSHQAHEPVFILRRLIEVSNEWDLGVCILDAPNSRRSIVA